jgi:predicted RNA-binding protein YlqC (UPF0109 family)
MKNGSDTEALVVRIVSLLVDNLDEVRVTSIATGSGTVFEVSVAQSDVGKVIGKSGRTARAIRVLLMAIGIAEKTRYGLSVVMKRESGSGRTLEHNDYIENDGHV